MTETEANRINYRLRSTFFYRKLKEYNTISFPGIIANLISEVENLYSWDHRNDWGIGEDAFTYISSHGELHILQVFCHPKILREQPRLVAYYRNIAALSQKAVRYLAKIDVKSIEQNDGDNSIDIEYDKAVSLAILFNEHITLIVDSSIHSITKAEIEGILLASTGAQIDGSWRNAIGEEAEKVVHKLLVNEAKKRNMLGALILRKGNSVKPYDPNQMEEQIGNIDKYRGIMLTNQTSILFSRDPDISLIDANGKNACVIEVKGGADPAGALERYGAAKKSFEEARKKQPHVPTILVASCITPEVDKRIQEDTLITSYYNLTELLSKQTGYYDKFMKEIFSMLGVQ